MIFVVDDDEALRQSLKFLLAPLGHPVEMFASAEDFLAASQPECPGCLVLDVRMPGMTGLDLQRELNARAAILSIVFISGHGDIPMVVRAMRAGAIDFLEKPFDDQTLLNHVAKGLRRSAEAHAEAGRRQEIRSRIASLTPREHAVMALVAQGKPNKVVAYELNISIKTVEAHRAHVMEKMQALSVVELTHLLMAAGT